MAYEFDQATNMVRFDDGLELPADAPGVAEAMLAQRDQGLAREGFEAPEPGPDMRVASAGLGGSPPSGAHPGGLIGRATDWLRDQGVVGGDPSSGAGEWNENKPDLTQVGPPAPPAEPAPPQRATGPLVNPFAQGGGQQQDAGGFMVPPARPGRSVRIEGRGFVPGARTVQEGTQLPEDFDERMTEGRLLEDAAAENELALREEANAAQMQAREREGMLRQKYEADRRERSRVRQQRMKDLQQQRDAAVEEVASAEVDPGRFWSSKSMPSKVTSFLAAALHGGLAARQGRDPGEALQSLMREQEMDVQEQQRQIQSGEKKIGNLDTAYGRMLERFDDEELARQAALDAGLATIQRKLEQQIASTSDLQMQNDLMAARAVVMQKRAEEDAKWGELSQDKVVRQEAYEDDRVVSVGGYDPLKELERQAKGAGYAQKIAEAEQAVAGARGQASETDPRYVPTGSGGFLARRPGEAEKQRESEAAYRGALSKLDKAEKLLEKFGTSLGSETLGIGTDAYHELKAVEDELVEELAKQGGGAVTDSDRDGARTRVGKLTGVSAGKARIRVNNLKDFARRKQEALRQERLIGYKTPQVRTE